MEKVDDAKMVTIGGRESDVGGEREVGGESEGGGIVEKCEVDDLKTELIAKE